MSANEQSQLQFDIYEKVTLDVEQPGIGTLLSVDLIPEVEIEQDESGIKIHGGLRLNGEYIPETEQSPLSGDASLTDDERLEQLSYVIPVEITLAPERVDQIEAIAAEIDSFDYRFIDAHELIIEANLIIHGLKLEQPAIAVSDDNVDAHDIETIDNSFEPIDHALKPTDNTVDDDPLSMVDERSNRVLYEASDKEISDEGVRIEEVSSESDDESQGGRREGMREAADQDVVDEQSEPDESSARFDTSPTHTLPMKDEAHETKVTFQAKDGQADTQYTKLDKLLASEESPDASSEELARDELSRDEQTSEEATDESVAVQEGEAAKSSTDNGLNWIKKLSSNGDAQFHQLKMVIVQKDDTLESIAERYDLSSVELLQINQLSSSELQEGQVVYIPNRKTS